MPVIAVNGVCQKMWSVDNGGHSASQQRYGCPVYNFGTEIPIATLQCTWHYELMVTSTICPVLIHLDVLPHLCDQENKTSPVQVLG